MILSSLRRLLPSRTMRLMTGFSRTVMTRLPVSAPVIVDVGEQLGRVEVLQRLIERLGGVGLARARGWRRRGSSPARGAGCRGPRSSGSSAAPEQRAGGGAAAVRRRAELARGAGCAGGGVACASSGAAQPPRMVPTRSSAPVRRLIIFDLEITRPRLLCEWCSGALRRQAPVTALPQPS